MAFRKGQSGNKGGRPKGSTTKPQIRDYINEEEVRALIQKAKDLASAGDTNLLKFLLEQIYGKAPQAVEVSNPDGSLRKIVIIKTNGSNDKTSSETIRGMGRL